MTALPLLIAASLSLAHAQATHLTIYHSDDGALFSAGDGASVNAGYAVVHEPRQLTLQHGAQTLTLDGLPLYADSEALSLNFPGQAAQVLWQRLLLPQGQNAALASLVGQQVEVVGDGGQPLAAGRLQQASDNGLQIVGAQGQTTLVRNYAAVRSAVPLHAGAQLQVHLDAKRAGAADATLSYPTAGLGWHVAYIGTLQQGSACRLQLESRASVANRSGRDWQGVTLKLIAGQPNMHRNGVLQPMMMMARKGSGEADVASQSTLGDYRSFSVPGTVDLPDGSVSQSPLYANRSINCQRTTLVESGNIWNSSKPNLADYAAGEEHLNAISTLRFTAFDSLPAGNLRVLSIDRDGNAEFIGEGQLPDTPKTQPVQITLGQVFDLSATRERSAFKVDRAARQMDEAFKLQLSNAGDSTRTVTVREHPSRWRQWTVVSSSVPPSRQSTDILEFTIDVPAHGQATLDYALRYQWSAADE
ncbi:MAG: DUF4139 domain-containing protein [Dyella sp.]